MIRVVFDTNVLFSAIYKRVGVPAQVIDLVTAGILTVSDAIMDEYTEVIARFAVHVAPTQTLKLCSDPDDDRFLECADEAGAEYLVTGNIRHFPKSYEAVAKVTPRALLQRLWAFNSADEMIAHMKAWLKKRTADKKTNGIDEGAGAAGGI